VITRTDDIRKLEGLLKTFPVVAIIGPRQCGKSTLARKFGAAHFFDLENPRDLAAFDDPQLALESLSGLIVIDEIQRVPELFPLLRYLVDHKPEQRYLVLGSASRDLLRQSSESLAGRIAYHELGGLRLDDLGAGQWRGLWLRGGLPLSVLAASDEISALWRQQYITTFLERDIPQLGIRIPAATLRRFWTMLCHYHGQILNHAEFARSFGISDMTVRRYLEILEGTFTIRLLQPWHMNVGKRLVKSPKLYLRDSGLMHSLLAIDTPTQLATHPKLGASWEGFALETIIRTLDRPAGKISFWATHSGAEVDLYWQQGGRNLAIEVKYASAPRLTPSMKSAMTDLRLDHLWVIYPGDRTYSLTEKITVLPLFRINTAEALSPG
jgi:hypothetical protein